MMITKRSSQRGNILFLILLAVVLFAALSYAVTSSMRGGGKDGSGEKADLLASQIFQYGALIGSSMQRLQLVGDYKMVSLTDDPANMSGTVYWGNNVTTTGKTVGLFNATDGAMASLPGLPDAAFNDPAGNDSATMLMIRRFLDIDGNNVGSAAPDVVLVIDGLKRPVCEAINKALNLNNVSYTAPLNQVVENNSYTFWSVRNNGTKQFVADAPLGALPRMYAQEQCIPQSSSFRYYKVIEAR